MFNTNETALRIRDARYALNMTQMELADAMGVSFQAVSNWERGNSMPDIGKLSQLCEILDISLNDLLGAETPETPIVKKMLRNEVLSIEELGRVIPLATNEKVEQTIRDTEDNPKHLHLRTIRPLAPYLDYKSLSRLSEQADDTDATTLIALAPYLEGTALDALAERFRNRIDEDTLIALAPFLSTAKVDQLVVARFENEESFTKLEKIAPYLSSKACHQILLHLLKKPSDVKQLQAIAPYLSDI